MTQNSQVILVSPHAHYSSHYWPDTFALRQALHQGGWPARIIVFNNGTELISADQRNQVETVFQRLPHFWNRLAAGKWEQRRPVKFTFLCETILCLLKAVRLSRGCSKPILHFIGGSLWPIACAVLIFRRIRFVYTLYGDLLPERSQPAEARPWSGKQLEKVLRRALATGRLDFVCETEFVRDGAVNLAGSHIHHIPAAIDDRNDLPTQEEARRRLDLPAGEKILLFFGTHRREKDYRTALQGCLRLPNPPLALFVGKLISENDPQRVVAECGYPKARIVEEFVAEPAAKVYFAAADAVALPYEASFSRGSQVLVECCRSLRPIIASATPYFSAFVARYGCGVVFKAGDSASFADTLGPLLANSASYLPALERARHEHSWAVIVNRYIELYAGNVSASKNPVEIVQR